MSLCVALPGRTASDGRVSDANVKDGRAVVKETSGGEVAFAPAVYSDSL